MSFDINNVFVNVERFLPAELGWLLNNYVALDWSNKKFKNFENEVGQFGDTIKYDERQRSRAVQSLIPTVMSTVRTSRTLTVNKELSVSRAFNSKEFIFQNGKEYMDQECALADAHELGSNIERDLLSMAESHTYRHYGDGLNSISTMKSLHQAIVNMRNYGSAGTIRCIIPDVEIPSIIDASASQFVLKRNEEENRKWALGTYGGCEFASSSLLPTHTSGLVGLGSDAARRTLTVVSTNDSTGANITEITCTCHSDFTNSAGVVLADDMVEFSAGSGVKFVQHTGHGVSARRAQFRVTTTASSSTTTVVVKVSPALVSTNTADQNINKNIIAGMTMTVWPSHICGLIMSDSPMFLAMPQLPKKLNSPTATVMDKESGISLRAYAQDIQGTDHGLFVHDAIYGKDMNPLYVERLLFKL